MRITVEMLRKKGACEEQVEWFEDEWPDGVTITEESAMRAMELDLDLVWAAKNFFSGSALNDFRKRFNDVFALWLRSEDDKADESYNNALAKAFYECSQMKGKP